MAILAFFIVIVLAVLAIKFIWNKPKWETPSTKFPSEWRTLLLKHVSFYKGLNSSDKTKFEFEIQEFLLNHKIVGIKTTVDTLDKLLVASSAVIPVFSFSDWKYTNLAEVLLYKDSFNRDFETEGPDRTILGMVGTGFMEGKMILSKKALRDGFANESDKRNTAIHEFVHLIDKLDGNTDGIPELLMNRQYAIPWIDLIRSKMDDIYSKRSDINPYAGTNKTEFFAVASEYFFERPELLSKKHPILYQLLTDFFKQDFSQISKNTNSKEPSRNDPCYCSSGKKYKHCCLV